MDTTYEATKRELVTDAGVLRYHEAGDGPPLVMLHGSGIGVSGWRNYRGSLAAFAKEYHCYVLEFPGFGVSDPVPGNPVWTATESVLRFMDALGLESAAVIGNSLGGVVGLNLAMHHPGRVDKLVCIGGVGPNLFSQPLSEGSEILQDFTEQPTRENLIRWIRCMSYSPELVTEELIEERWQTALDPDALESIKSMYGKAAFAERQRMLADTDRPPYWAMMHKVACPTLLAWGRDDRQTPLDMALLPLRSIPNAELHVFPNCGHWIMLEAKDAFERTALEFLQR
ncbi:alpha/beta fold hydrolase [Nocardia tengchongensis]|uniref:alpha/beta fold hydrolase n=1 Tax=Nocardia tengchongensis TaxID=2055889 RepID=UPI00367FBDBC